MVWFTLLIPITLSLLSLYLFKHKLVWWEVLLPTIVAITIILIMKGAMINSSVKDTEYWSEFIIEGRYYEEWDEYIEDTCESCTSDDDGNETCVSYDCSYVSYHSEYWEIITNIGNEYRISENEFNYLVRLFGNKSFIDMGRDFHNKDGDVYKTNWNNEFETIKPLTLKKSYENKPQAVSSVFKFSELDSIEKINLYNYPELINQEQKACLGCKSDDDLYLRRYNALWGSKVKIKVFVLLFDNKPFEISERQRSYWAGGNKNELVICADRNGKWVKSFSWCDNKEIEVRTNNIFSRKDISLKQKIDLLDKEIDASWELKDFHDFDYIDVPLSNNQLIWVFVVVLIFTIGILIFGITNEIEEYQLK